jgi:rod shape-determining protein MreC
LVPAGTSQKVRLTLLSGFHPFQWLATAAVRTPGRVLPSGETQELRTRNEFLEDQVRTLSSENARLKDQLQQASGLKPLLPLRSFRQIQADVVLPTDASPWRKSLTLAAGTRAGLEKGMLVVYNQQLVGRIAQTGPWTSRVAVVTDPAFRAGAVAVPRSYTQGVSLDPRHTGLYAGTSGANGVLKWIAGDTPVDKDTTVLTTEDPENGVPRGLILGRVSKLASGRSALASVEVEPILEFRALEHVTVLVPEPR